MNSLSFVLRKIISRVNGQDKKNDNLPLKAIFKEIKSNDFILIPVKLHIGFRDSFEIINYSDCSIVVALSCF